MPPKKSVESDKSPDVCILRMGKANNVIQWREEMYNVTTGLYGSTVTIFNTNVSYFHPLPQERDYNPLHVPPVADPDAADEQEDAEEGEDEDSDGEPDADDAKEAPVISASLMRKLGE